MNTYPLQALLYVHQYREHYAQSAINQAKQYLKNCEQNYATHKQKIIDYHTWRLSQEEQKYTEIIGKKINITTLEDFKQYFVKLKEDELLLEKELLTLENQVQEAKKVVEQKKAEFNLAKKNITKLNKHYSLWKEKEQKKQEQKEETELEEFKPIISPFAEDTI